MNFAVVPAAGRSSRLGRAKALLPFANSVVVDRVVETLSLGGIDRIVVVTAPGEDRLLDHCAKAGISVVFNERVADGMLSSIQCGLRDLGLRSREGDTLTVCPVDFPALRADTVATLISALRTVAEGIVVPRFLGRRGHPLALSAGLSGEILKLDHNRGLRVLLDLHPYRRIDVDDPGVHRDLDTWLDYLELSG